MNGLQEALVLVSYGAHGVVRLADGTPLDCKYRRQVGRPCCGDHVEVAALPEGGGAVERILPRRNHFLRADAQQRPSIVAANLDQVLVVIAARPLPTRDLMERYLLAVHSLGIEPVIVLNKAELPQPADDAPGAAVLGRLDAYRKLGYTVAETSCKAEPGIENLLPLLGGKVSILVGQSGVGKSSLARRLLPDLDIQTGALSRATGKGTHTTTTTILYDLPGGGALIDSPGVWEYGLWRLEPAQVAAGFREFLPFIDQCRFNDCLHASEPGCALKLALEKGTIARWRYESYLRILAQNEGF